MRERYVKRDAQQVRYRAARAIIVEALLWFVLIAMIWKGVSSVQQDDPPPEPTPTVRPIHTVAEVTVRAKRPHLPGLYGCQGSPK